MDTSGASSIFDVISMQSALRDNSANTALSNGISLMQKKKYSQAVQAFKQAAALKPDLAEAYAFQGDGLVRLGQKKEAEAAYKLAVKVDKTLDSVYSSLAGLQIDLGKKKEAAKTLQDAVKVNWQNTPAWYTLGHLQVQDGKYKEAEESFKKVVRLEPRDGNGYYGLGLALNGQKKYDEAIFQLNKATSLKRDFSAALGELGQSYIGKGDTAKVKEIIEKLTKMGTNDASLAAFSLKEQVTKPKIGYADASGSSLSLIYGPLPLLAIDSDFSAPGATKDMTVKFVFDSDMDMKSVKDITNWSISKASGGDAGLYNNGLYSPKSAPIPAIPKQVNYDPLTRSATLTFSVAQNATLDATIDTSHLVFKFKGTDSRGVAMDPKGDEYNGFRMESF